MDPTGAVVITKILTWIVAITQFLTTVVILIMHVLLVNSLVESQTNITKSKAEESNAMLVVQLVFITISNILCWFPASAVFVSTMFLKQYPADLLIWTVIGGLPINSLIIPSVFVGTTVRKYLKSKKPKGNVDQKGKNSLKKEGNALERVSSKVHHKCCEQLTWHDK